MSQAEANLAALGLALPAATASVANYVGYVVSAKLVFVSGQLPFRDGKVAYAGRLGDGLAAEDGYAAARPCALNVLAQLKAACEGDLDRVSRVLRLNGYVNSTPAFTDAPRCVNGASDLMVAVFGDAGRHSRAAVGVASLPLGAAVEIDAVVELK